MRANDGQTTSQGFEVESGVACVKCKHINEFGGENCANCGARLFVECHMCGKRNRRSRTECSYCGARLRRSILRDWMSAIFPERAGVKWLQVIVFLVFLVLASLCVIFLAEM